MITKLRFAYYIDTIRTGFMRREDGSVAIETVIIIPIIFWAYLCMFAMYDSFRALSVHQKAAYTLSDAVSRETSPLDDDYLTGIHDLYEYLAHSQGGTEMRLSQIWYDGVSGEYRRDWSEVRGSLISPLTNAEVRGWDDKLPLIPANDRLVLLETWTTYEPPFKTGLSEHEIRTYTFTRPRYAPVVCFDECN